MTVYQVTCIVSIPDFLEMEKKRKFEKDPL